MHTNHRLESRSRWTRFAPLGFLLLAATLATPETSAARSFSGIDANAVPMTGTRYAAPLTETVVRLDLTSLGRELSGAALARTGAGQTASIELPLADGSFQTFRVFESPVMAPALQAQFPECRTFEAYGVGNPAFARFSLTPLGFHAVIFRPGGSVWIDPYQTGDIEHYSVCLKRDYRRAAAFEEASFICLTDEDPILVEEINTLVRNMELQGGSQTGDRLRTYATAIAATGEYTAFHGGTVALGQAAIVVAVNRLNEVFQREFSAFLELVPNNSSVVYTNGGTDPYTNNNGGTMLTQNQSNLDAVIGSANYDFGHVFSTGGGGIAQLSCVCLNGSKAKGVTGLGTPIGDNFYIDYVAHEMGHQLGSTHSFNSVTGACGGGNRTASTAFEPGSGTTIMSYAGICGADNIQPHSDDYFHVGSFVQIRSFTENGSGNNCPTNTATGNLPPVADATIGGAFTIPKSTPFSLTGAGTDDDGDVLTFCWEEYDLGPAGPPNGPTGNAPIFRSFDPVATSTRLFPRISDIVNNVQTKGEIMASYARNLRFRMTVRDNRGGVHYDEAELIAVAANGPFLVTSPNIAGIIWDAGLTETVTWDVAGTDIAPVSCALVNILLSTDGGFTYPTVLASNEPNDGSADVPVPIIETTTARVMVEAADNLFFDISNVNFEIAGNPAAAPDGSNSDLADRMFIGADPNPFQTVTHLRFRLPEETTVTLKVYSAGGREVATLAEGVLPAGEHARTWDGTDYDNRGVSAGVYFYRLEAAGRVETQQTVRMQ